ncbi:MAG: hypothetical protein DCC75_01945 [Proteobacteria bacterium]|nr:MAG: hypothetical protein DCC75_01945 [Pseudomonadota bacterium]
MGLAVPAEIEPKEEHIDAAFEEPKLSDQELRELRHQRAIGRIFFLPLAAFILFLLRFIYRIEILGLPEVRSRFVAISKRGKPLVICSNHLTMVDSIIIQCALASAWRYLVDYRLLSWNIPAIENYHSKPLWRLITYLGKCIPIDRNGSADHTGSVLAKLKFLLSAGETITIFPEGTRSRTGRVNLDEPGYGIGKIIRSVPECEVLCIYLRGRNQTRHSTFPAKGDKMYMDMELVVPERNGRGLRGVRETSLKILSKIKAMEDKYLSLNA